MKSRQEIYGGVPKPKTRKTDFVVPVCMFALFLMGVVFIYSAQSYSLDGLPLSRQLWFKQIVYFVTVGMPVYMFLGWLDYRVLYSYAHIIYGACILLLVPLVLKENFGLPIPLVDSRFNATRWIDLGFLSIQPSEFAKIGTCIMAAALFARNKVGKWRDNIKFWWKLAAVILLPILLIFLQPDLGSTLVFFPMVFSMLYISELPKKFFLAVIAVFAVCIAAVTADIYGYADFLETNKISPRQAARENAYGSSEAWTLPIKDYQRNRILAFVAPDVVDPSGQDVSWNHRQSLISVGTGGLFGKGVAAGTQAKLGYLPPSVAYNDFIFSVLAEESGFAGGTLALALMGIIVIYGCVGAARVSGDRFGQFLCTGIATIIMTHIFINVGMTIGIMPITGVPLPMLSYGGTFVLTCCILLGLVQSVYRHRREYVV